MAQEKSAMRFLFGDRELLLAVADLLSAPVEVIVNPADCTLQHQSELAQQIRQRAGKRVQQETEQLIREYGQIDAGMAVYTSAGELPFKAIIHAVGPVAGGDDEQRKLEQVVSRSLQLCEMNEWSSIGFPAIEIGHPDMPVAISAEAYFRAITRFWDARHECQVEKVFVVLNQSQFRQFFDAFREQGFETEETVSDVTEGSKEGVVGEIDLSEADFSDQDNTDIDSWFK